VEIKKIVLSIATFLIATGVTLPEAILAQQGTPPSIKVGLALMNSQPSPTPGKIVYNWGDPIRMVITLENQGIEDVITTKGFPQRPFHLLLVFTGPDGKTIVTQDPGELSARDAPPPKVFPVQGQLKQVEPVEKLYGGASPWVLSVEIPDARAYYPLTKAGNYSVKAVIPMRAYHQINYPGPPEDYSEIDQVKWSGTLQSDTAYFALAALQPDSITISPDSATIPVFGSQTYIASAHYSSENSLDVTSLTAFTITPDGLCTQATCTAAMMGDHTVTGRFEGQSDEAALHVLGNVFGGFYSPVNNLPTLNVAKAGSSIPVKFSLNGDQGLKIFSPGYPTSQKIACDSSVPVDNVEETVTAGGSSLSYNPASNQYTYVWKTDKAWAGSCRQFIMKLKDGMEKRANFNFKK
jgi:hypothetical protein